MDRFLLLKIANFIKSLKKDKKRMIMTSIPRSLIAKTLSSLFRALLMRAMKKII